MRKGLVSSLLMLSLVATPVVVAAAESGRDAAPVPKASKSRTIWTVVGAGAGFVAGIFIGIAAFDDAIYSERKVTTTAILVAAAGAVAGNLLSADTANRWPARAKPAWPRKDGTELMRDARFSRLVARLGEGNREADPRK